MTDEEIRKVHGEIAAYVQEAQKLLHEAERISNKYGVPFHFEWAGQGASYNDGGWVTSSDNC